MAEIDSLPQRGSTSSVYGPWRNHLVQTPPELPGLSVISMNSGLVC
jgi:hypothetical protein